MRQHGMTANEAIAWAFDEHQKRQATYKELIKQVPRFSAKIDKDLDEYIVRITHLVRGNISYSFASSRYFKNGLEVQRTRQVPLYPKIIVDPTRLAVDKTRL
jgi:hypothetical protein